MPLSSQGMDNAPKYTKNLLASTHQDKNHEIDAVGLYSVCQCNVIPCTVFYHHNVQLSSSLTI